MLVHFPEILHVATKIQMMLLIGMSSHNSTSDGKEESQLDATLTEFYV